MKLLGSKSLEIGKREEKKMKMVPRKNKTGFRQR